MSSDGAIGVRRIAARARRRRIRIAALGWGLAGCLLAASAAGELRRVESVGTAPVRPGAQIGPLRDAARDAALREAVRRVARDQLDPARAGSLVAAEAAGSPRRAGPRQDPEARLNAVLDEALGPRPLDYLSRFRVLEDRGERAALFSDEPGVEAEYVVVVEALVDTERVFGRLERRGLPLLTASREPVQPVRLELVDLEDYGALAAFQRILAERLRMPAAVPVEMQRGRAVLELPAQGDATSLLSQLRAAAEPELRLEALGGGGERLVLRVSRRAPAAAGASDAAPGD